MFPYIIYYKQDKKNIVTDKISHSYIFLSTLGTKLLYLKQIKELYAIDHDFCEEYKLRVKFTNDKCFKHDQFQFHENKLWCLIAQ